MPELKTRWDKEVELRKARESTRTMTPDEAKILRLCKKRIKQIKNDPDRISYMSKLSSWDKQYRNKEITRYYVGEANCPVPMTFEVVETIVTYLLAVVCYSSPLFKIKGFENRDRELAEDVWYPWMKYQTTKRIDLEDRLEKAITYLVKYGTVAVKNTWKFKDKRVKKCRGRVKEGLSKGKRILDRVQKIIWDYPDMQIWPLQDVFFDTQDPEFEEFDFVAFRGRSRFDQLLEDEKKDIYHHVKWLKDDKYKYTADYWVSPEEKRRQTHLQYVEWYMCYFNFDLDKDGYAEECIAVIANDKLVIQFEQNPYDEDFKPLLLTQFVAQDNSPYGMGVPEILEQLQIELNDTANQTMDNATFILNNMWIVDTMALDLAAAEVYCKSKQSGVIPIEGFGVPVGNLIQALEKPDIITAGILKMKMIREWGREAVGSPHSLTGMPSAKYKPTATEFAGLQTAAMRRLTKVAKRVERRIVVKWLDRALALSYQYVSKEEILKVVGDKAVKYEDKKKEDLLMNCDFVAVGSMEVEDKTAKVQQLIYYLKVAISVPPEMSRVNIPRLLREIWKAMGDEFANIEADIFLADPQKELIAPEDENALLETGSRLLPHVFDPHDYHMQVHRRGEQTPEKERHIDMHQKVSEAVRQKMSGQGSVGAQELPVGGQVTAKPTGEAIGENKVPPVL